MKTIHKYILEPKTVLQLRIDSEVLSVGVQNENVVLYVKEDLEQVLSEMRTFVAFGTGHTIDDELDLEFIGTVFLNNGLVFHIFEDK